MDHAMIKANNSNIQISNYFQPDSKIISKNESIFKSPSEITASQNPADTESYIGRQSLV